MRMIISPLLALLLLVMVMLVPTAVAEESHVNDTVIAFLDPAEYPPFTDPWLIHDDYYDDIIAPDGGEIDDEIIILVEGNPPVNNDNDTSNESIDTALVHEDFIDSGSNFYELSTPTPVLTHTDPTGFEWTQVTPAAGWSARALHTTVSHAGYLWVLGGRDSIGLKNDVWRSADGITWTQVTPEAGWSARDYYTSVSHNGYLWVLGGSGGGNDVWRSADGETWTQVTSAAGWSARFGHTAVSHDGCLWVLGGRDSIHGLINDVWRSSDGETWTEVTSEAGWLARVFHTTVSHDGYLWVIGGYDGWSRKNDVWRSSDGIIWTQVTSAAGWSARDYHTSVSHNGYLWVLGGWDSNGLRNDVWRSSDGVTWTQVTSAAEWSARLRHTTVSHNGYLWVLGGEGGGLKQNDVWRSGENLPILVASFTAIPTTGAAPLTVQFTDQSTNSPTSWRWEYSTGGAWTQFSTSKNPSYQFTSAGTYSIRLTVANAGGNDTETKTRYVAVTDAPIPPEHSLYLGHTAVSIGYLIGHPVDAQSLVNRLISEQGLSMADLWYRIGDGAVVNILTGEEATPAQLAAIQAQLRTYIDENGNAHNIVHQYATGRIEVGAMNFNDLYIDDVVGVPGATHFSVSEVDIIRAIGSDNPVTFMKAGSTTLQIYSDADGDTLLATGTLVIPGTFGEHPFEVSLNIV